MKRIEFWIAMLSLGIAFLAWHIGFEHGKSLAPARQDIIELTGDAYVAGYCNGATDVLDGVLNANNVEDIIQYKTEGYRKLVGQWLNTEDK